MRAIHRWMMLVFGVLIAYWAITGVALAVIDITDSSRAWAGDGGGPGSPTPTVVGGIDIASAGRIDQADVQPMVQVALRAARVRIADAAVTAVELTTPRQQARATVSFAGPTPVRVAVDTRSGAVIDDGAQPMPPGSGPMQSLHSIVKSLHRGNITPGFSRLGAVGIRLSLLTGVMLIAMIVTGLCLYLTLWNARRRIRRPSIFWRDRSTYRWLHRWVSVIALVFLLNQAITGVLLAWFNITDTSQQPSSVASTYADAEIGVRLLDLWQRAHAAAPAAPIVALVLTHNGSQPFGPVIYGGPHAGAIGFRLPMNDYVFGTSGEVGPGGAAMDSHSLLKRIHRGDIIGSFSGRYLSLFAGLSMLWLLVSGLVMYLQRRA